MIIIIYKIVLLCLSFLDLLFTSICFLLCLFNQKIFDMELCRWCHTWFWWFYWFRNKKILCICCSKEWIQIFHNISFFFNFIIITFIHWSFFYFKIFPFLYLRYNILTYLSCCDLISFSIFEFKFRFRFGLFDEEKKKKKNQFIIIHSYQ